MRNQVQLITYPDSLGGDLRALNGLLDDRFRGLFGGVHILPPYPSSGDRGFAPIRYNGIDPRFGTWEDIKHLARSQDVVLDFMVNHMSRKSEQFQDFLNNGSASPFADMFIPLSKIWPDGEPVPDDVERIFRRRERPFSDYAVGSAGEIRTVWTTFGKQDPSEQIDIDIESPVARSFIRDTLSTLARGGARTVRLDAIPYVIKRAGTDCFFVEPDIYDFLEWVSGVAKDLGIELLPELHSHHALQDKLARRGYWTYDFVLPFLVLQAMITGNSRRLRSHLRDRPNRQITMLDCHDGVPVKPDLDDIVETAEARETIDVCVSRGARLSRVFSPAFRSADGFDVHQISGTYFSLLDRNDNAFVAARAIQLFAPGIPQVYYVGLLAGENDEEGFEQTGDRREVNRHNYTTAQVEAACDRPVVQRLMELIRFRNHHPAFGGEFLIHDTQDHLLRISWTLGDASCALTVDLRACKTAIVYTDESGGSVNLEL